jgi:hypothetical protein
MTPQNGQQDSPPDGFRAEPETDSDRRMLSLATISEWMSDMGRRVVSIEDRLGHVGSALATVAQAIGEVRAEQRRAAEREADATAKLAVELASLRRQDSVHDDAITQTGLRVVRQETALGQLKAMATWQNVAKGSFLALLTKAPDILAALVDLAKTMGAH